MTRIKAAITGVGGYVPDYVLDNAELSRMVDTSDEWIMQRIGIRERRIMKEKGKATSTMGARAVKELLKKTNTDPQDIQLLICATVTADMHFPATGNLIESKFYRVDCFQQIGGFVKFEGESFGFGLRVGGAGAARSLCRAAALWRDRSGR